MVNKPRVFLLTFFFIALLLILSGCINEEPASNEESSAETNYSLELEEGENISFTDDRIIIDQPILEDGLANFYNLELEDGRTVYFFVLKDKNGVYRAAGNACQVCFDTKTGFHQEDNFMVCNTCGNKYPFEKIATEKGGCNPIPINPNLPIEDGKIIIERADLEQIYEFF